MQLFATGCATTAAVSPTRALLLPLGDPVAPCTGGEERVTSFDQSRLRRELHPSGEACTLRIEWSGPLLEAEDLRRRLTDPSGQKPGELVLVFESASLTDELGAPLLPLAIEQVEIVVSTDAIRLAAVESGPRSLPLRISQRATLKAELLARVRAQAYAGRPLQGQVRASLLLTDEARRKLARQTRGPGLQIRFQADLQPSRR